MSYERIKASDSKVVGSKQVTKAVEKGQAVAVVLARNAEDRVVAPLARLCENKSVEVVWVEDMVALGKACGIEVPTAAAAILAE